MCLILTEALHAAVSTCKHFCPKAAIRQKTKTNTAHSLHGVHVAYFSDNREIRNGESHHALRRQKHFRLLQVSTLSKLLKSFRRGYISPSLP